MFLRQSTSQVFRIGPFVDDTDGVTPEAGLTIANTDVDISKDGAAFAAKNSGGLTADGSNGWYSGTFDATDTNTVGVFEVEVTASGALPVFKTYYVVEEAIYDKIFAGSAAFNDLTAAAINAEVDTAITDAALATAASLSTAQADLDTITGADGVNLLSATQASIDAIEADTNELQTDWVNGGRLDLIVDAILADTNELQTDDVPTLIAALNDISVADILTTQITESYAAVGAAPTLAQFMSAVLAEVYEKSISGTTVTWKQRDQSTTAATGTLDDGTTPTSVTQAT